MSNNSSSKSKKVSFNKLINICDTEHFIYADEITLLFTSKEEFAEYKQDVINRIIFLCGIFSNIKPKDAFKLICRSDIDEKVDSLISERCNQELARESNSSVGLKRADESVSNNLTFYSTSNASSYSNTYSGVNGSYYSNDDCDMDIDMDIDFCNEDSVIF